LGDGGPVDWGKNGGALKRGKLRASSLEDDDQKKDTFAQQRRRMFKIWFCDSEVKARLGSQPG